MDSVKIKKYVGQDGILSLQIPVTNQDVEAMVIYQATPKNNHQKSKRQFQALLASYAGKEFGDSTTLLREDRQRD